MENLLYLIKVSACAGAFYILYLALFRNSTFFIANRIYLLAALLFSFIIPVLDFSWVALDHHLPATEFFTTKNLPILKNISPESRSPISAPERFDFITLIYFTGFGVMMLRLIHSIVRLLRLGATAGVRRDGIFRIVRTNVPEPFSFFNLIFLPKGQISPFIVEHEKAHVRYHHWVDLLLLEISGAILWFNPIMIFYKKSLRIQHEYEADNHVIRSGADIPHYLDCILNHLESANFNFPISQFYSQNIKKRIVMMTQKKTSLKLSFLYTLFIPLACLLLFAFARPSVRTLTFSDNLITDPDDIIIVVDAGHGGNDHGGSNNEGLSEKEFTLAMARNIQKTGEAKNIKVILTRTDDNAIGLEERVKLSGRYPSAVFISIHANYNKENTSSSGIDCIVSERNNRFQDSERLAGKLMGELQTLNGISVNGIKKSDFYVLSRNSIPAILLELGYLSNKNDNVFLNKQKNQQQISEKIIASVVQYSKTN